AASSPWTRACQAGWSGAPRSRRRRSVSRASSARRGWPDSSSQSASACQASESVGSAAMAESSAASVMGDLSGPLLEQHQRAPAAFVVALAAARRQVVGRAGRVAALLLEVVVRLGREAEQLAHPQRPRLRLQVAHQLAADPLVLVARI